MSSKTITGSRGELTINNPLDDSIRRILRKAAPSSAYVFNQILKEIEEEAKKNWPVRQPVKPVRDKSGNIKIVQKGKNKGKPRIRTQKSKRSIDKFKLGQRIEGGKVVVFLENSAQYAYAIRMGIDTKGEGGRELFIVLKKRIALELLIWPLRRNAKHAVEALTRDLFMEHK